MDFAGISLEADGWRLAIALGIGLLSTVSLAIWPLRTAARPDLSAVLREQGQPDLADFVALRLDSVRTAGYATESILETAVFAASASDITDVVVGGRTVVTAGRHHRVPDVPTALRRAVAAVTREEMTTA